MIARTPMFELYRRRVAAQSTDIRALFVLLALSISLQICAPEFRPASQASSSGNVAQSFAGGHFDTRALHAGGEDLECCAFAAQHSDRGQIVPLAISVDFIYLLPVVPAIAFFVTAAPYRNNRVVLSALSTFAPAHVPIYLSTQRFRN